MSNILKGILNETSPHNYDSDWDYQDAVARSGKSRSGYRSQEDDTFDDDVAYSRKMYQLGQQQKAAKEKAQRDSDHDRLATGTNEGVRDLGYDAQSLIMKLRRDVEEKRLQPTRQAILAAARELAGDMNFAPELLVQQVLGKGVAEGVDDPWGDQGNFAGDKPVNVGGVSMKNIQTGDTVKYLGQPSKVVAMSKDGKHSRITITKGIGTVTQDVLTSDLQQLGRGTAIEEDDKTQTRMRMNDYYALADAIQEKLRQAIQMGDNELVHKLSKERADLDARVKKYGLMPESEQLDELSNEKLSQYKTAAALDAGKADSEGDYKRADKRFSGIVKATKKQFANDTKKSGISQGISEDRFNSKQEVINHFVKNGKSAAAGAAAWERGYRGSSNKPIELKKPPQRSYHDDLDDKRYSSTFENLGDQLKSQSLEALQQIKQQIEQKRAEDLSQWEQDFRNNVANKMRSQPIRPPEDTPVAQPGEKHSVLKDRLAQLNNAIQKQQLLDKLVDRLERKGLLTPAMQNDTDTRMHVRYGAKDNYQSLNKKLDNAIEMIQSRLNVRKISGLKEVHDERDEYDNPRLGRDYGKGNLFVDPGSTEFPKEKHPSDPDVERGRPKNLKGVSKSLPADAFGRTTGKIPAGKRGTVHSKMGNTDEVDEGWSQKYKSSINCSHPKGFSQKAHCAGKKKHNESIDNVMEMTCPDCGMCQTHGDNSKDQLDELKCWSGYHRVAGTKAGFPGSCAKNKTNEEGVEEGSLNELSSDLLKRSAQAATDKRNQAMDPELHNALGGGYMNPLATHYDNVSQKMDNRAAQVRKKETIQKIASPAVMRKIGMAEQGVAEAQHSCPHCGGEMVSEELMNEKKDACYYKVKSRYKVWPSAYASGALVKCRNKGASNWGNGGKKNESSILEGIEQADESLHDWFNKEKWVRMDTKGNIKGPCAREPGEGKPKCLPQSKAHSLGKKGRASAAQRKRREDPNPERTGKAINVDTKKSKG